MVKPLDPPFHPCRELEAAARDVVPDNPAAFATQWRNALHNKILEALPPAPRHGLPFDYERNTLAKKIASIVIELVGQADEILAEAIEKLNASRTREGELSDALDHATRLVAEHERDYERLRDASIVQRIELERTRDIAQDLEIKLAGAEARITAAEEAERKLRGGN